METGQPLASSATRDAATVAWGKPARGSLPHHSKNLSVIDN